MTPRIRSQATAPGGASEEEEPHLFSLLLLPDDLLLRILGHLSQQER